MTFTMIETTPWRRLLWLLSMPLLWWLSSSFVVDAFSHPRHAPVRTVHCSTTRHMNHHHHHNNNNNNNNDKDGNDETTIDTIGGSSRTWSVTDDWNQLSQSDQINYDYGAATDHNDHELPMAVLNSIDQVTLAALRMQNFGMSAPTTIILSEEDEWIQNSIQQIMVVSESAPNDPDRTRNDRLDTTTAALNTERFLEDMGDQIARMVRCQDDAHVHDSFVMLDECELFDDAAQGVSATTDRQGKSSYQRVEVLSSKQEIPIWMKDGEFVFIDEQSCIGCMQCASAAPGSFQMLEQGRARTFCQRNSPDVMSAVASCPVDCMHYVSFDELKELEIARDVGVADDHRHFGHSSTRGYIPPTPLHISRRDSDANHKSSFYHFIQDKCSKSSNCPQRGCYDCPKFAPGKNPYFQEKLTQATHVRAEHFKENGIADAYRKTANL